MDEVSKLKLIRYLDTHVMLTIITVAWRTTLVIKPSGQFTNTWSSATPQKSGQRDINSDDGRFWEEIMTNMIFSLEITYYRIYGVI